MAFFPHEDGRDQILSSGGPAFLLISVGVKASGALYDFEDTRRENSPSNETPGLAKSTNMYVWVYIKFTIYNRFLYLN